MNETSVVEDDVNPENSSHMVGVGFGFRASYFCCLIVTIFTIVFNAIGLFLFITVRHVFPAKQRLFPVCVLTGIIQIIMPTIFMIRAILSHSYQSEPCYISVVEHFLILGVYGPCMCARALRLVIFYEVSQIKVKLIEKTRNNKNESNSTSEEKVDGKTEKLEKSVQFWRSHVYLLQPDFYYKAILLIVFCVIIGVVIHISVFPKLVTGYSYEYHCTQHDIFIQWTQSIGFAIIIFAIVMGYYLRNVREILLIRLELLLLAGTFFIYLVLTNILSNTVFGPGLGKRMIYFHIDMAFYSFAVLLGGAYTNYMVYFVAKRKPNYSKRKEENDDELEEEMNVPKKLEEVLENNIFLLHFRRYLLKTLAVENLEFMLDIKAYEENFYGNTKEENEEEQIRLAEKYFLCQGVNTINVPREIVENIRIAVNESDSNNDNNNKKNTKKLKQTFNEAKDYIYNMLQMDLFPRFLQSHSYRRAVVDMMMKKSKQSRELDLNSTKLLGVGEDTKGSSIIESFHSDEREVLNIVDRGSSNIDSY